MHARSIRSPLAAAALLLAPATPQPVTAQYFGRNKVQYEDFSFKVMETTHFAIYHYEREQDAVEQAARLAERWYRRLSDVLDHDLRQRQPRIMTAHTGQPVAARAAGAR